MAGVCVTLLASAAATGVPSQAPAAQGRWLPPSMLSPAGLNAGAPHVAVAPDGTTTAAWSRWLPGGSGKVWTHSVAPAVVQVGTRRPGGRFGAPVNVSDGEEDALGGLDQLAVGADGTTAAVWSQYDGLTYTVWASTRPPHGTFRPQVRLSAPDQSASASRVAVAPDGTTTVVWLIQSPGASGLPYGHSTVQASTAPPDGTFGPAVELAGGHDHSGLRVAAAANGATTVAWLCGCGVDSIVQTTTRNPGGRFGMPVDLSVPGQVAHDPELAVAADGTTTVVWSGGVASPVGRFGLQATTSMPGGTFGPPVHVSAPARADHPVQPDIAVGPNGATTVLWSRSDSVSAPIQSATRRNGDSFGKPVGVPGSRGGRRPQLAIGADGTMTAVWVAPLPAYRSTVRASTRLPGRRFGVAVALSPLRSRAEGYPQVAVGPDGGATAVWVRPDVRGHRQVWGAVTAQPLGAHGRGRR